MSTAKHLTPAQRRQIEALGDGKWHRYNGRRLGIIERLNALGLVEYEYLPGGAFGLPNWFHVRLRIRKGDIVNILPAFRDPGDEKFTWVAADDEEKGRVSITPLGTGLAIAPRQTVEARMVERIATSA